MGHACSPQAVYTFLQVWRVLYLVVHMLATEPRGWYVGGWDFVWTTHQWWSDSTCQSILGCKKLGLGALEIVHFYEMMGRGYHLFRTQRSYNWLCKSIPLVYAMKGKGMFESWRVSKGGFRRCWKYLWYFGFMKRGILKKVKDFWLSFTLIIWRYKYFKKV